MLDGEATDSGLIEDEATAKTSVNSENGEQVLFYEPDLNGFAYTTEIIYYNSDNISDDDVKIISIKEYIDNGKKFSIKDNNKTYIFADYSNYTQSHLGKTTTKKPIWANIRTTSNGLKANWVWIPRYAYKITSTTNPQKVDIIFINTSNQQMNGDDLPEGYTVHPVFAENSGLKGIWFSKYNPSYTSGDEKDTTEAVPDLSKFVSEGITSTTKLIYYTANGSKTKEIDFTENPSQTITEGNETYYFYDYNNKIWANVKTTANNLDAYWVWIPRYAYKLEGGKTNIILIDSNNNPINTEKFGNTLPEGYTVHEAFVQDTDIRGMWFSKYNPSEKN